MKEIKAVYLSTRGMTAALYPFDLTRHVSDLRVGILTIREKWERLSGLPVYADDTDPGITDGGVVVPANVIPTKGEIDALLAGGKPTWQTARILSRPWHIFEYNDWALREDFRLMTAGRTSVATSAGVHLIKQEDIFIEAGAKLSHCVINATTGPVYIAAGAEVMEGCTIRGPLALGEGAVLKMGSRVYGATSIGPRCVAGGEIKNSVMLGWSNKAHDGYLGDSVVGEWCNLGAGCSNSNIKNTASEVRVWDQQSRSSKPAGIFKCGLLMGDYSRAAINTSFNTGTVVGICANVFGAGLTPKHIPSFSWGATGNSHYDFEKAMSDIRNWKKLKGGELSEQEKNRLRLIFDDHQFNS